MYKVFKPKSAKLQQYVSEFTILRQDVSFPIQYFAFPHYTGAIVILNNAKASYEDLKLIFNHSDKPTHIIGVLGKYVKPIHVSYLDKVEEIAINFTPTGLNYFFDQNYAEIATKPFQLLTQQAWIDFSNTLFETDGEKRIEVLEAFLITQLRKKDLSTIEQMIDCIHQNTTIKIKELTEIFLISERTINRLFNTYLGCSPTVYKKIVRFRKSVKMNNSEINLTELCLNNEYYDSPHFTREFHKLTGQNPRKFFSSLTLIEEEQFPYIFK